MYGAAYALHTMGGVVVVATVVVMVVVVATVVVMAAYLQTNKHTCRQARVTLRYCLAAVQAAG